MLPLTKTRPKVMIPVLNIPILEHIIKAVRDAGIREFLLVTGYLEEQVKARLGDGSQYGVSIEYVSQPTDPDAPYGTAAAVSLARDFVGNEPFFLTFGDIMTPKQNYRYLLEAYEADRDACWLCVNSTRDVSTGGAVFVEDGMVVKIVEKPAPGTVDTNFINSGIFIMKPDIFEAIKGLEPSSRGEYELPSAVTRLIKDGVRFKAHQLVGYWSNLSSPAEVIWLNNLLMQKLAASFARISREMGLRIARGENFHGLVCVGEDTEISPQAEVVGPAIIGDNCHIGRARIGRYTCIGSNCRVADGSTVVASALFEQSSVEENARVGFAILGSGVKVGRGAACLGTSESAAVVEDNGVVTSSG